MATESKKMRLGGRIPLPVVQAGSHLVNDYIAHPHYFSEVTESLISAIANDYASHAFINFERLTPWCFSSFAKWAEGSSYKIVSRENDFSSVFNVCSKSSDDFFKGLGKKSRGNVKYYSRLLERECGVVKFSITEPISHEESTRMFDTFLHIEKSGWKGQKGTSLAQIEKSKLFYKGLCDTASDDGLLRWYQLFAGEKLVSMNMVMCYGSTLWVMKTAYDENCRRYSPGTLGLTEVLKTAIEDLKIKKVRMITNYPWLDKWRPDKELYIGVRIFLPSISGRMAFMATSLLKKDWKVLK
jgi:hypothetical protein